MEFGLALILLIAWWRSSSCGRSGGPARSSADAARRAELEAAKESKYREIRDAELDQRMGKLSDEDWRATDRELRAEAIEILRELDSLEGPRSGPG